MCVCVCARARACVCLLWVMKILGSSLFITTHMAKVTLHGDMPGTLTLQSGTRQGCVFVFNIVLEVLTSSVRHEKEMNIAQAKKEKQKPALFTATVSSVQKAPENRDQLRKQIREHYTVSGYLVQPSELAVCFSFSNKQ